MTDRPSDDGHREVTQQQLYNTINNNDKITEAVSNYLHYYHDTISCLDVCSSDLVLLTVKFMPPPA